MLLLLTAPAEARQRTNTDCTFTVLFYEGKYFTSFGSIFPVEDIIAVIPPHQVCMSSEQHISQPHIHTQHVPVHISTHVPPTTPHTSHFLSPPAA